MDMNGAITMSVTCSVPLCSKKGQHRIPYGIRIFQTPSLGWLMVRAVNLVITWKSSNLGHWSANWLNLVSWIHGAREVQKIKRLGACDYLKCVGCTIQIYIYTYIHIYIHIYIYTVYIYICVYVLYCHSFPL